MGEKAITLGTEDNTNDLDTHVVCDNDKIVITAEGDTMCLPREAVCVSKHNAAFNAFDEIMASILPQDHERIAERMDEIRKAIADLDGPVESEEPLPDHIWKMIRSLLNEIVESRGEWAGAPMPVGIAPLTLESRYPYQGLHGHTLQSLDQEKTAAEIRQIVHRLNFMVYLIRKGKLDKGGHTKRNKWWYVQKEWEVSYESGFYHAEWFSTYANCYIEVWKKPNGKVEHTKKHVLSRRFDLHWKTNAATAEAHEIEVELKAQEKLKSMLSEHQWKYYVLTGTFVERSKRSGVLYMFRRLRPTVAITDRKKDDTRVLTTLCMHPIGYYEGTFAGCMCPTDDVIAHLTLMRGDEPYFWRKANHHPAWQPEAGL